MNTTDNTLTHPADGRFYLTLEALARHRACDTGTEAFRAAARKHYGEPAPNTPIPVTLAFVVDVFRRAVCGLFVLDILVNQERLARQWQDRYWDDAYGNGSVDGDAYKGARVFMDALAHAKPLEAHS